MLGVGRDLCGSSSPTPLPKQGHLEQTAQDHVQAGLEYLQRRRIYNLSGQPVPLLSVLVIVPDKVLFYFICTIFKRKKHTKGHVLGSTDCLEFVIVRWYPESTEHSLSLNHNSEGNPIYS